MNVEAARHESLKSAFDAVGQGHVFAFWDSLADDERRILLDDLQNINIAQLPGLTRLVKSGAAHAHISDDIRPASVTRRGDVSTDVAQRGEALIAEGRAAAFTVAGGQGTRLGFDGPKGALPMSPVKNKPLFQLFAEYILAVERRYRAPIPWYIMTSPGNDAQTRAFFEKHRCFGLDPSRIAFFQQGVMPAFDAEGRILLEQRHRPALSPDGHGGSLLAMATSGVLRDMASRGVEYISYFQVDNPLVMCVDPVFIGLHAERGAEMSSKTLPKADDLEKVGNFVECGGRQMVIEYSDLPEALARARNADGTRRFDAANIAIHILSRAFVERLTADRSSFALPWHLARKKVPHVDLSTGERVEPSEPNGVKVEAFVFDALPLARNPVLLETSRAEEFSPVKNPSGVDSVESARRDMSRRAADWLERCGVAVSRGANGEPTVPCEISPLAAMDMGQLRERIVKKEIDARRQSPTGGVLYID